MNKIKEVIAKYRKTYCAILIGAIVIYIPFLTNRLCNPDAIAGGFIRYDDYSWENCLGRYGLKVLASSKGYLLNPFISTIVSLVVLCAAVVLICDFFSVERIGGKIFIATVMIASVHVANGLTYHYCFDFYLIAMLLAIGAIWYAYRFEGLSSWIVPPILMFCSYTLYQAYISIAMVLAMTGIIMSLLSGENLKNIYKKALRYICAGGAGTLLYLVVTKLGIALDWWWLTDGRGFSKMGNLNLGAIPQQIVNCYRQFIIYYFTDGFVNNSWEQRKIVNLLFFIVIIVGVVFRFAKKIINHEKIEWLRWVYVALIGLLLPVAFMIEEVLYPDVSIYDATGALILPAMNLIYVLAYLVVSEITSKKEWINRLKRIILLCLCTVICWILILYVAIFEQCMINNIEVAKTTATMIIYDVNQIEDVDSKTIAVVGEPIWGMPQLYDIVKGTVAPRHIAWTTNMYGRCLSGFFAEYCYHYYAFTDYATAQEIDANSDNMTELKCDDNMAIYYDDEYILVRIK